MASVLITELESFLSRAATGIVTGVEAEATKLKEYLLAEEAKLQADIVAAVNLLVANKYLVTAPEAAPAPAPAA